MLWCWAWGQQEPGQGGAWIVSGRAGNDIAIPPSAQRFMAPEIGDGSSTLGAGLLTSSTMGTGKVSRKWRKLQGGLETRVPLTRCRV